MKGGVACVVGGQFGSEGKGAVVAHIAKDYKHHVRVGAANAGHTFYTLDDVPCILDASGSMGSTKMWIKRVVQQLPVAAYANPDANLYIGPGALISPRILEQEIRWANEYRTLHGYDQLRVHVDYRAHIVRPLHVDRETLSGLADRIGSTSAVAREGIGAAQAARVMREESCMTAEWRWASLGPIQIVDVPAILSKVDGILLEGTQGYGLSLTTGAFPYVTSRNTTSAGLCADCGVAPNRLHRVIVVFRTYPIRVAGPSGPFARGSREITWEDLEVDPESERTTVTRKVRRVANFSPQQAHDAIAVNGGTEAALMFADYDSKLLAGATEWPLPFVNGRLRAKIDEIERWAPVTMLGTGPYTMIDGPRRLR